MKIWLDDIRPAPEGYIWLKSVIEAQSFLLGCERVYTDHYIKTGKFDTSLLPRFWDIDHDAGEYATQGGDYIEFLKWLEMSHRTNFTFKIHSQNPVGVENMRRIIKHNEHRNWKEIK